MTASLIEGGVGWSHVKTVIPNVDPVLYFLGSVQNVVDGGRLPQYAVGESEMSFFNRFRISTLSTPVFVADENGYNSGNELLGSLYGVLLDFIDFVGCDSYRRFNLIINRFAHFCRSGRSSIGRSSSSMECFVPAVRFELCTISSSCEFDTERDAQRLYNTIQDTTDDIHERTYT